MPCQRTPRRIWQSVLASLRSTAVKYTTYSTRKWGLGYWRMQNNMYKWVLSVLFRRSSDCVDCQHCVSIFVPWWAYKWCNCRFLFINSTLFVKKLLHFYVQCSPRQTVASLGKTCDHMKSYFATLFPTSELKFLYLDKHYDMQCSPKHADIVVPLWSVLWWLMAGGLFSGLKPATV